QRADRDHGVECLERRRLLCEIADGRHDQAEDEVDERREPVLAAIDAPPEAEQQLAEVHRRYLRPGLSSRQTMRPVPWSLNGLTPGLAGTIEDGCVATTLREHRLAAVKPDRVRTCSGPCCPPA